MDRRNFGHGQLVTEGELDGALDPPEDAERNMAIDHEHSQAVNGTTPDSDVFGGIIRGLTVTAASGATAATVALGICKDQLGRRISLPAQATVLLSNAGDCPAGIYSGATCKGDGASIISSVGAGDYIVVSLFLVYDEELSDQRQDASGTYYYFVQEESFHFRIEVGTSFTPPPGAAPSRASLADGKVLLADLLMTNNGGTFEMVASGVLLSNENWDDLGANYADNTGRRSDWLALDDATDFPRYEAESTELRVKSAREGLYELVKQLQISASTPSGADLLGARALTGNVTTAFATQTAARNLTAGDLAGRLQELLDLFRNVLHLGGNNILTPAASVDGIDGFADNLSAGRAFFKTRTAQAPDRPQRITGFGTGHIARAHELFEDFIMPNGVPAVGAGVEHSPFTFQTSAAGVIAAVDALGGVQRITTDGAGSTDYISTGRGGGAALTWNIGAAPYAICMFRFRVPSAFTDKQINMGFYATNPLDTGASNVEIEIDATGLATLYSRESASGTRSTGTELNDTNDDGSGTLLVADAWYTARIAVISNTEVCGQINQETWKTDTNASGTLLDGGHCLGFLLSELGSGAKTVDIDQAFAADAVLAADMV